MPVRRLLPDPLAAVDVADAYRLPTNTGIQVRANMVSSADGAATCRGRVGPLTGPADQEVLLGLRALADVVLVGAGTIRAEGYGGPLVPEHLRRRRLAEGRHEHPCLAVVSGRIDLDLTAPLFTACPRRPLLLTSATAPSDRLAAAKEVADVLVAGDERVDLRAAVEQLASSGLPHILSEGGPHLLAQLFAESLVDELCLTVAPTIAGGDGLRVTAGPLLEPPRSMTLTQALTADGHLFLTYRLSGGAG